MLQQKSSCHSAAYSPCRLQNTKVIKRSQAQDKDSNCLDSAQNCHLLAGESWGTSATPSAFSSANYSLHEYLPHAVDSAYYMEITH